MKLFSGLLSLLLLLTLTFSPVVAQTNDAMSPTDDTQVMESNETAGSVDVASIFWPIVPGTTVADGTFFFKQLKEGISGMFTFGNIAQAKYQTELSKKRIVEANKLVEDKDYGNAVKSMQMSEGNRKSAIESKRKAGEAGEDTAEVATFMVDAFNKEKQVLEFFSVAVPADQKAAVDEQVNNIDLQISEAK